MIGRVASALGLDRNIVQNAIGAVVPSLLAGFSRVAAQPGGAQKLVDAATQQTDTLESFARMLGSGNQSSFVERGSQTLSSLLGSQDQSALAEAISKFTGMGQGATGSLLGMLAPIVLGTITQQQGTARLDPGRLAGLLASQKENIAAALPSGLSKLLAGTALDAARMATAATGEAARAPASTLRAVGGSPQRTVGAPASGLNKWLYWLIPAAAVAALLIYFLAKPIEQVAQQSVPSGQSETSGQSLTAAGLNIDKQLTDSIASLRATLGGIIDAASAREALPKLRDAAAQIDKVSGLSGQLSAQQRKALSALLDPLMPTLNQLFDKVLAVPGVSDELKPTIDALKSTLATLTA
jgi:hypothetical protein